LKQHDLIDMEITQATICKSRSVSTGTMLLARNPVTIISATKT
jgi:cobalt-precorrin-6B (C15)-methyltransferase